MVERGEVVEVELDLGALDHLVAEPDEDVLDLALSAHQQVLRGGRRRRGTRHRHVDRAGDQRALELGRLELRVARLELGLERLARRVGAGADRAALGRVELGDPAQDRVSSDLRPR